MEKLLFLTIVTQIIIESLPISSSGHVMLVSILAKKFWHNQEFCLPDILDPLLHTSALLAITITFYRDWQPLFKQLTHIIYKLFSKEKLKSSQQKLLLLFFKIIGLMFIADLITAIFYFLFKIVLKNNCIFANPMMLILGFSCTGLILFSLSLKQKFFTAHPEPLDFTKTLILGIIQGLAFIPGISRFASTYAAGCWLNLGPRRAFQISFLLHLPLIISDVLLHGIIPLFKNSELLPIFNRTLIISALISTIIATLLLMLTYKLALKNKLWIFCFYMLIPIMILIFIN